MMDIAEVMEDLCVAIANANSKLAPGTTLTCQLLPLPGRGCLVRLLVAHNYANGFNISQTEVAIWVTGQIEVRHPLFRWEVNPINWGDLLARIVDRDVVAKKPPDR